MCTQKEKFYQCYNKLINEKNDNSVHLSSEKYSEIMLEIKNVKINGKKTNKSYRLLKRFDIVTIDGEEKLIFPLSLDNTNFMFYIMNDHVYDVLHDVHLSIGHGGKHRMNTAVKKKYKNITQESILIYLKGCVSCQSKLKSKRKGLVVKPLVFSEINSRCQVDIIDMQSQCDGEFRFIMVYQDNLTKFVQLRPLKTKDAEEVAKHLMDIFCIFGAPMILQSDSGREFVKKIIDILKVKWETLKIVHGKPRYIQTKKFIEIANQDIQKKLILWMKTNNTKSWSEGLRFIQLLKNKTYHDGIKRTPNQAMFGIDIKIGLSSSLLPIETLGKLSSEEDLEEILQHVSNYEQDDNLSDIF